MRQPRTVQAILALAVLACGTMGSVEWSSDRGPARALLHGDFTVSVSSAAAGEARAPARRASCAVVRFYVARYTAGVAEAWARSKRATNAEIEIARGCIKPQLTAQLGAIAE